MKLKTAHEFNNFLFYNSAEQMVTPGSWHIVAEVRHATRAVVLCLKESRLITATTNFQWLFLGSIIIFFSFYQFYTWIASESQDFLGRHRWGENWPQARCFPGHRVKGASCSTANPVQHVFSDFCCYFQHCESWGWYLPHRQGTCTKKGRWS